MRLNFKFLALSLMLILLATLGGLRQTYAQEPEPVVDDYPSDGFWGADDPFVFNRAQMQKVMDDVNWDTFPVASRAFYPIEGKDHTAFTNSMAMFQKQNGSLINESASGCLSAYTLGQMYHLGDDMFANSNENSRVTNMMVGRVVYQHLIENPGGNYPGDVVVVLHKLPNGQPIFSMIGHMARKQSYHLAFTDERSNPRYSHSERFTQRLYVYGGENFYWTNASNIADMRPATVYNWGGNTHVHWELRYFEQNPQPGLITSTQYQSHHCSSPLVGPGYMPLNENGTNPDGTEVKPDQMGWYSPSEFLVQLNAGAYGWPVDGPVKDVRGVTFCNLSDQCVLIPPGLSIYKYLYDSLGIVLPVGDNVVKLKAYGNELCIDSDVIDLRRYVDSSNRSIIVGLESMSVERSGCGVLQKPQLASSDDDLLLPYSIGCHKDYGIRLYDDKGRCFGLLFYSDEFSWFKRSLPFNPTLVKIMDPPAVVRKYHIQLFNAQGECLFINTDGGDTPIDQSKAPYIRGEMTTTRADESCIDSGYPDYELQPDFPALMYRGVAEDFDNKFEEHPTVHWNKSEKNRRNLKSFIHLFKWKSGTVVDPYRRFIQPGFQERSYSLLDPANTVDWKLDDNEIDGAGVYGVTAEVGIWEPGSLSVVSNLIVYEIVNEDSIWNYFGWNSTFFDKVEQGASKALDFTIPDGQFGYLSGTFSLGGNMQKSIAAFGNNSRQITKLSPGSYSLSSWSGGSLTIGTSLVPNAQYEAYLLQLNAELSGEEGWTIYDPNAPVVTPTPTPTPTNPIVPTLSPTPTPSSTGTPVTVNTATSTPTPVPSNTSTLTPSATPTGTGTTTATITPSATASSTSTATATVTVGPYTPTVTSTATTIVIETSTPTSTLTATLTPTPSAIGTLTPEVTLMPTSTIVAPVGSCPCVIFLPLVNN
jgi:hypothetical protein